MMLRYEVLALLAMAALAAAAPAPPDEALRGFTLVARDDCGVPGQQKHRVQGDDYTYPTADLPTAKVPADSPTRTVAFGEPVLFRFTGLRPEAKYRLRVTYLSEHQGRVQTLSAGGKSIHGALPLPDGEIVTRVLDLPAETYRQGSVDLEFRRQAGPNAVVSVIELWSDVPTLMPRLDVTAYPDLRGGLAGAVLDAEGAPAAGAAVDLSVEGTELKARTTTDREGRFAIPLPTAWRAHPEKHFLISALHRDVWGTAGLAGEEAILALPRLSPPPVDAAGLPESRIDLTGVWRFHPQPPAGFEAADAEDDSWSDIHVPGEWAMQGFTVPAGAAAGYRRMFTMPAEWQGMRLKLRCDGVYSDATVWVNGKEAGRHEGGFTPFELDVTPLVRPGTNTLALAVKNDSDADRLASGSKYAAHPLGGITRKLYLFAAPEVNVASLHVTTTLDRQYHDATLNASFEIANEGARPAAGARVSFALAGPDGKPVALRTVPLALAAIPAGETLAREAVLPIANPAKWDPEHPNLYTLSATLEVGGKPAERVKQRFGFRQIEVRGNQVFVNGRPIKLRGVCRHETHPVYGRALGAHSAPPTPPILGGLGGAGTAQSLWEKDARLFRDANVNFIRTSHYPPAEEFLDACDEMGIWVEDEAPFCWAPGDRPADRLLTLRQTLAMLQRDRSHPCVLLWSLANESKWGANFQSSAELVHRADPTRLRIFSYGAVDVASWHYPGPGGPERAADAKQPTLFDEYCHLNAYNREEIATDPGVRDEWGRSLAAMWEKMLTSKGCLGGSIWAGIDDVFDLSAEKSVGYGEWGPLDGWRRPKPEYWHVHEAYSPVRILDRSLPAKGMDQPLSVRVANRHDFTNLSELRVEWEIGGRTGTLRADVPPHGEGTLTLPALAGDMAGRRLSLRFLSPRGFTVEEVELPVAGPLIVSGSTVIPLKPTLQQDDELIVVAAGRSTWRIDRKTGQIGAEVAGRRVLQGGPELMVLPLKGGPCATTFTRNIPPDNACCSDWQPASVTAEARGGVVEVRVEGRYSEAKGGYTLTISGAGVSIAYRFTVSEKIDPRQIGLVFGAAKPCTLLAWERDAQWSVYPPDHIGRPRGETEALGPFCEPRVEPAWPWSQDATGGGTNDFRATRRNIHWASLRQRDGAGVRVQSDGKQHFRAWMQDDRPRFLVADYTNGGGEPFERSHFAAERRPLEPGSVVEGTVRLELLAPAP